MERASTPSAMTCISSPSQPDGDSPADQRRSDRHEKPARLTVLLPLTIRSTSTGRDPASRASTAVTGGGCAGCGWPPTRCSPSRLDEEHEPFVQPRTNGKEVKGTKLRKQRGYRRAAPQRLSAHQLKPNRPGSSELGSLLAACLLRCRTPLDGRHSGFS
jgi:hypothetical protein